MKSLSLSIVLCASVLTFASGCKNRSFNGDYSETDSIKKNGNKIVWVDTHDFYAHAFNHKSDPSQQNFVKVENFPYFHRRADGKRGAALTMDCA